MSTRTKDVLIVLVVGVVAFFAYKMWKRRAVTVGVATQPPAYNPAPAYPPPAYYPPATSVNQLPPTGGGYGVATGGGRPGTAGGTSGAQDFASIASGIASLGGAAAQLAGAFGGQNAGGSWGTSSGGDTYFGGGPGDDSGDPSYYID
jgi:hypothetical protein